MEVRLVDIQISSSSGRHSTRAIVLKLLVRCLLASGILPLVLNAEGFSQMRIRVMTEQDIPAGLRLNTLSGWNQTSADWERFLVTSPRGCFVMEDSNNVVGTAATICYENRFAWVGMVLVDPEYRKQGIGTQLLNKTIEHLDHANISTIKLDATPLGKPLYAKLGFVNEFELERWILKRSPSAISTIPSTPPPPLTDDQQQEIFTLD